MRKQASRKPIWERAWIKAALLLLTGMLLFLLERRKNQQPTEDNQPVIWRRDIEMGPTDMKEPAGKPAPQPAETHAGESYSAEMVAEEMPSNQRAAVKGPIPLPEDEDNAVETQTPAGDDLAIVEGIGPKINSILHQAGIRTFAQLAEAAPERLEEILRGAGLRLANPETWPDQARLAAAGEWNKLENLQKKLKAGRKA